MNTLSPLQPSPRGTRCAHAALVLAAHRAVGTTAGDEPVRRWARMLARRRLFADVRFGFVKGEPALADALAAVAGDPVYVVPFFMADGWFVRTRIPQALGRARRASLRLCQPVGTSPRLAGATARMALAACRRLGISAADTGVLLVAHGTPREKASGEAAGRLAMRLDATRQFADVAAAFLEEPPDVAEGLAGLAGKAAVAVGIFAAAGRHGADDVPRLLRQAADDRPVVHAGTIGDAPGMIGAILERVLAAEAAGQRLSPT